MDACLSEDVVAALVDGTLDEARFVVAERHISECKRCMHLVAQVGGALDGVAPPGSGAAADAPPLVRGVRVGRYEILEPIGVGGMGRVYAARDPALDRNVALKLLHPSSATAHLEARLLREAKAMARLSHPEVIGIFDVGYYGEQLFIAMELVEGGTLREWLLAAPRPWKEVLAVFLRAGRGLARAHAAGIIHRDFKPDNVLVGTDGRVRVTDFGLARTAHPGERSDDPLRRPLGEQSTLEATPSSARPLDAALTRTGTLLGTPAYMAPEQHAGAGADARSDVYSFCVALYEALRGERPFLGKTLLALQAEKLAGRASERSTRGGAPDRVTRAVLVGLRPRPEERYESMDELLDALERAARAPRWPVALAASLVVVVGAGVALAARRPSRPVPVASAIPSAAVECTNNRACVESHHGAPFVCMPSQSCAPVASEDCVAKFEPQDLESDDTVWLGAMFPTKGPGAEDFGTLNMETADFARSEVARTTKSLGGAGAAHRVRRIALVECDDSVDAARAAHHLVDDVGVPAILGFRSGQEVVDLAESLLIRRGVLSVATVTSSPLITRLPQPSDQPRMVWRTTYNLDAVATVVANVISDVLEPRSAPKRTRVTLLRSDVAGALSFGEKLFREVHFNGKSALENAGNYAEVTFPPGERSAEELANLADRVAATKPTILVLQGDESTVVPVVEGVEARMKASARKPTYLAALYTTWTFGSFIGLSAERRHRVYGVESLTSSLPAARFVMRYNDAHDRKVTRTENAGVTYDAFYALAYATFANGSNAISGANLARGFARLVGPGDPIEVGPTALFDGLAALARGGAIDLTGTQSGLDFDLSTGDEPTDFTLLCPGVDRQGRVTTEDVESGVVFRAATKKLEGSMRCP